MDTPYWQKFTALAKSLASSPRDAVAWARHLPVWGRRPSDLELPWWSYGAIRRYGELLRPTHRVFEYGSGGSSFFTARRAASVLSVENDPAWHQLVTGFAQQRKLANLTCELHLLQDDQLATFQASTFCRRVTSGLWDVIIIDCHCGFQSGRYGITRPTAFAASLPQVNHGGFLILDDSWMYPELLAPRAGWIIKEYIGTGPCRYGVTSTAVFQREA
jgi:hypothetical protein